MGFNTAIKFLDTYRRNRFRALNNETRQEWSTTPVTELDKLSSDIFNSKDENSKWAALFGKSKTTSISVESMSALALQIAFLAGCRRDIGAMDMAGAAPRRVRTSLDHDRYELTHLLYSSDKTNKLQEYLEKMAKM